MPPSSKPKAKTFQVPTGTRNFVKEAAKIKVNLQAVQKQYRPGVYEQHQYDNKLII